MKSKTNIMNNISNETIIFAVVAVFLYVLPSIVATKKKNFLSIFVLNMLLGWTFLGWCVALIWAVKSDE